MTIRLTLLAVCLFLVAIFVAPKAAPSAVPHPTPTPVGLQYDEINRMAIPPATPPPPGAFAPDYAAIINPPAQANSDDQPDAEAAAAMKAMGIKMPGGMPNFMKGDLKRWAFYKGWIRVDDVVAKTAEIRKCDLHQFIELDLNKKTYRLSDQSAADAAAAQGGQGQRMGPGTAVFTVKRVGTALGPMTLEGVATKGYHSSLAMNMTNASGSCEKGSGSTSFETQYVSGIHEPRAFCPMNRNEFGMAMGGCKPTMKMQNSGAIPPRERLVMYSKVATLPPGASDESAAVSAFVTERGNVKVLFMPDATALFTIPRDFTKE